MPQQSSATKKPVSKTRARKAKQPLFARLLSGRYAMPSLFVAVFMAVGITGLYLVSAATTTYTLWGSSVPRTLAVSDSTGTELGVKFRATVAGYATGVRFYKGAQNTGSHTGSLWDSKGNLLASVVFKNESSSGWQTAMFTSPVSVASNVTYIVSYHAPNGHYSLNKNYLSVDRSRKNLMAPHNTTTDPNGVFVVTGTPGSFPTQSGNGANYWVDVLFNTKLVSPQPAPAAPAGLTAVVQGGSVLLSWQPSVSASPISKYTVYRDGSELASAGTALGYTDTTVQAGTTYSYQVRATDSNNITSALSQAASAVVPGTNTGGDDIPPPPPTPTGATTCPLPAYPSPSCTGVPSGTAFVNTVNGDYTVTTPGQVIDKWDIKGSLHILADDTVVKNSSIGGTVNNQGDSEDYYSFSISDSTVGPVSGCVGSPGVGESRYTATRVLVRNHDDGFRLSGTGSGVVQDSYFHACYLPPSLAPPDGSHSDGVQAVCGVTCSGFQILHTTFDLSDVPATFPLNLVDSHLENVIANDNLLLGGNNYLVVSWWRHGANWTFWNNRFVQGTWGSDTRLIAAASAEGTCSHQDWQGNTVVTLTDKTTYGIASIVTALPCQD